MRTQGAGGRKAKRTFACDASAAALIFAAILLGLPARAEAPSEFPPSPVDTAVFADRVPESARGLQIPLSNDYLGPVSTNRAGLALLSRIRTLQTNLTELEAAAYAQDPWLKLYDQYQEVPHEWVMQHHRKEFGASLRYFGPSGAANTNADARTRSQLVQLVDMALYTDLARNTNFTPLLQGAFEAAASRVPALYGTAYSRNDALIGYHPETRPTLITNFQTFVAEHEKRYDRVQAKLAAIQRAHSVPADAIAGQRWGDLYRLLASSAQLYVEARTPEQLIKLRQELRRKYVDLSQLRASLQSNSH